MAVLTIVCLIGIGVFAAVSIHWNRKLVDVHKRIAYTLERFLQDHEREAERAHEARQMRAIRVVVDDEDITNSTAREKNCA